jgi:hypothetical protein
MSLGRPQESRKAGSDPVKVVAEPQTRSTPVSIKGEGFFDKCDTCQKIDLAKCLHQKVYLAGLDINAGFLSNDSTSHAHCRLLLLAAI